MQQQYESEIDGWWSEGSDRDCLVFRHGEGTSPNQAISLLSPPNCGKRQEIACKQPPAKSRVPYAQRVAASRRVFHLYTPIHPFTRSIHRNAQLSRSSTVPYNLTFLPYQSNTQRRQPPWKIQPQLYPYTKNVHAKRMLSLRLPLQLKLSRPKHRHHYPSCRTFRHRHP